MCWFCCESVLNSLSRGIVNQKGRYPYFYLFVFGCVYNLSKIEVEVVNCLFKYSMILHDKIGSYWSSTQHYFYLFYENGNKNIMYVWDHINSLLE